MLRIFSRMKIHLMRKIANLFKIDKKWCHQTLWNFLVISTLIDKKMKYFLVIELHFASISNISHFISLWLLLRTMFIGFSRGGGDFSFVFRYRIIIIKVTKLLNLSNLKVLLLFLFFTESFWYLKQVILFDVWKMSTDFCNILFYLFQTNY